MPTMAVVLPSSTSITVRSLVGLDLAEFSFQIWWPYFSRSSTVRHDHAVISAITLFPLSPLIRRWRYKHEGSNNSTGIINLKMSLSYVGARKWQTKKGAHKDPRSQIIPFH